MSEKESPYEPAIEAIDWLQDAVNRNTAILRDIKGLLIKPPVRSGETVYPVATWRLHELTGLPICWLFLEYDHEDQGTVIIYDGDKYRVYQGSYSERLYPYTDDVYGHRQEDNNSDDYPVPLEEEQGVKLVRLHEGVVIWSLNISSGSIGIATYGWRRINNNQSVSGLQMKHSDYRVSIYPDDNFAITIAER